MSAIDWIVWNEPAVGRSHPNLTDVDNRPLRQALSKSGYDPDASFSGFEGPLFHVKAYGALGDGLADDTTAIQNALNAAVAAPTGGRVFLPPGSYVVSARLRLGASVAPDNLRISGYGAVIKPTAAITNQVFRLGDTGSGREASNLLLEGFTIDMSAVGGTTTIGMALFIKQHCVVRDINILTVPQHGFSLAGLAGTPTDILMDHCYVQDAQGNAVLLSNNVTKSVLRACGAKNTCITQLGGVFYVFSGDNNVLDGCWADTSQDNGFRIAGSNNRIVRCHAINIKGDSFRLTGNGTRGIIESCVAETMIAGGSGHAFRASGHTNGRFIACEGRDCANGVRIDNLDGVVKGILVKGCHFESMQPGGGLGDGVNMTAGSYHQLVGNTFKNMGRDGIRGDNVTQITAVGNVCYDDQGVKTQVYGVRSTGTSDYWLVQGNMIRAVDHVTGSSSLVGANNLNTNNIV